MMQRITLWFQAEYKRTRVMGKRVIVRSVILTLIIGVLLLGFGYWLEMRQKEERTRLRIGYVAEEDMLTRLLVSYVAGMDSLDKWCRFVPVTEQEGREGLQEGELAALLILPENVIDEILSGSNAPATLLLPSKSSGLGIVFEELADTGIRMLSAAQGEIYAVIEQAEGLGLNGEQLLGICDDINAYNMELFLKRETWFEKKRISATGNEEVAVYYGSAFMAFWLLLCGVLFGSYIRHDEQEQLLVWKRLGIAPVIQLAGRIMTTAMLLTVAMLPLAGLWLLPGLREYLMPVFSWQSLAAIFLAIICTAAYDMLLYQLCARQQTAVVAAGIFAVLQGYTAGYMIPTALLPRVVQRLAKALPAGRIRQAFSMLFSCDTQQTGDICAGLLLFISILACINVGVMYHKTGLYMNGSESVRVQEKEKRLRVRGNVFWILVKRMLQEKSFWFSFVIIAVLSMGLVSLERQSETRLTAAFYDASGEWEELLCGYDGYIQFLACDSEEEVRELVLYDEAECGYLIPEDFRERIQKGKAKKSIVLFKDSDAMMAETVNEILFEQLFGRLSREWFVAYMGEADLLLPTLERKLTDGSTFEIRKEYCQTEREEGVTYPIWLVVVIAIALCGIHGVWDAVLDFRRYCFFKRNPFRMAAMNIFLSAACGLIFGIFLLLFNSY